MNYPDPFSRLLRRARVGAAIFLLTAAPSTVRAAGLQLISIHLVRESLVSVRCFFSGHSDTGTVDQVNVTPYDASNNPLPGAVAIPMNGALIGVKDFGVWSNADVAPWAAGYKAFVKLKDTTGATSNPKSAPVPPFGGGSDPTISRVVTYWNDSVGDARSINVSVAGGDLDKNTGDFRIQLFDEDNNPVSDGYYDAVNCASDVTYQTSISVPNPGAATHGLVTATDVNGNVSAPFPFRVTALGFGSAPTLDSVTVTPPAGGDNGTVRWSGQDGDADQATAVVDYLRADQSPIPTNKFFQDLSLTTTGLTDFAGQCGVPALSDAVYARVTIHDAVGHSVWGIARIPGPFMRGDADGDGVVTLADALIAMRYVAGGTAPDADTLARCDVFDSGANAVGHDGALDIGDVQALLGMASGAIVAQ